MSNNVNKIKQEYIDQYFISTEKASIDKFMIKMLPYSDEELGTLKMPVLILIGDDDMINDEKSIEKAKKFLPYAKTEIITNAGHFLSIDQDDVVNRKMLQFLGTKDLVAK